MPYGATCYRGYVDYPDILGYQGSKPERHTDMEICAEIPIAAHILSIIGWLYYVAQLLDRAACREEMASRCGGALHIRRC